MVDPYLSDSLRKSSGDSFSRLQPIRNDFFDFDLDVLILTHGHADHADPETLEKLLRGRTRLDILCPAGAYAIVKKDFGSEHNVVLFDRGCEWTINGVCFRAVKAVHSDPSPIGVLFAMEGTSVYVTGDTLFNREIFHDIDIPIDLLFVCMNGAGNNMNIADAVRFAEAIKPKAAIPMHWGMFERYTRDPEPFLREMERRGIGTHRLEYGKSFGSAVLTGRS